MNALHGQEACRTNQTYKYSVHVFVKNKIAVYCAKLHVTCESSGKDLESNSLHGTHAKLNFNSEHHVMVHNVLHTQLASTNRTLYLFCINPSYYTICTLSSWEGFMQKSKRVGTLSFPCNWL